MFERARQGADDVEPQSLPQTNRAIIGADDEVELHRPEVFGAGVAQRVLAHLAPDAPAGGSSGGYVTTVADVLAATRLIRPDIVSPHDDAVLRDERLLVRSHPVRDRVRFAYRLIERICLARAKNRSNDRPDGVNIIGACRADQHREGLHQGCERSVIPNALTRRYRNAVAANRRAAAYKMNRLRSAFL